MENEVVTGAMLAQHSPLFQRTRQSLQDSVNGTPIIQNPVFLDVAIAADIFLENVPADEPRLADRIQEIKRHVKYQRNAATSFKILEHSEQGVKMAREMEEYRQELLRLRDIFYKQRHVFVELGAIETSGTSDASTQKPGKPALSESVREYFEKKNLLDERAKTMKSRIASLMKQPTLSKKKKETLKDVHSTLDGVIKPHDYSPQRMLMLEGHLQFLSDFEQIVTGLEKSYVVKNEERIKSEEVKEVSSSPSTPPPNSSVKANPSSSSSEGQTAPRIDSDDSTTSSWQQIVSQIASDPLQIEKIPPNPIRSTSETGRTPEKMGSHHIKSLSADPLPYLDSSKEQTENRRTLPLFVAEPRPIRILIPSPSRAEQQLAENQSTESQTESEEGKSVVEPVVEKPTVLFFGPSTDSAKSKETTQRPTLAPMTYDQQPTSQEHQHHSSSVSRKFTDSDSPASVTKTRSVAQDENKRHRSPSKSPLRGRRGGYAVYADQDQPEEYDRQLTTGWVRGVSPLRQRAEEMQQVSELAVNGPESLYDAEQGPILEPIATDSTPLESPDTLEEPDSPPYPKLDEAFTFDDHEIKMLDFCAIINRIGQTMQHSLLHNSILYYSRHKVGENPAIDDLFQRYKYFERQQKALVRASWNPTLQGEQLASYKTMADSILEQVEELRQESKQYFD